MPTSEIIDSLFPDERRRAALLLLLLAVSALAVPYAGFTHDGELYAGQVLRRLEPSRFTDDILLDEGTKTSVSIFVPIAEIAAKGIGLAPAFFLLHGAARVAFLLAVVLIVELLLPRDRVLALIAMIVLATSASTWGGFGIFSTHEPFLTPRLPAVALGLLGLVAFLRDRRIAAALLLSAALLIHPLMAAGPIAVVALLLLGGMGDRWLVGAVGAAALAIVALILTPALAGRIFGHIDPGWRAIVALGTPEDCPWLWPIDDLCRFAVRVAVVLAAALRLRDSNASVARLALATAAVAVGGFALTTIAGLLGWALPFQAQFHRAEWLLAIVSVPLALALGREFQRDRSNRLRDFVPIGVAYVIAPEAFVDGGLLLAAIALPFAVIAIRGVRRDPRNDDWLFESIATASVGGLAMLGLGRVIAIVGFRHLVLLNLDAWTAVRMLAMAPGAIGWTLATLAILHVAARARRPAKTLAIASAIIAVVATLGAFEVPRTNWYRTRYEPEHSALDEIADYVRQTSRESAAAPIVYWPTSRIGAIWFDVGARCYYSSRLFTGSIFSRALAFETARRARVVAEFEAARLRPRISAATARDKRLFDTLYVRRRNAPPMTIERLCREPLDIAVLPTALDEPADVTGTGLFVYDCRRYRESQILVAAAGR